VTNEKYNKKIILFGDVHIAAEKFECAGTTDDNTIYLADYIKYYLDTERVKPIDIFVELYFLHKKSNVDSPIMNTLYGSHSGVLPNFYKRFQSCFEILTQKDNCYKEYPNARFHALDLRLHFAGITVFDRKILEDDPFYDFSMILSFAIHVKDLLNVRNKMLLNRSSNRFNIQKYRNSKINSLRSLIESTAVNLNLRYYYPDVLAKIISLSKEKIIDFDKIQEQIDIFKSDSRFSSPRVQDLLKAYELIQPPLIIKYGINEPEFSDQELDSVLDDRDRLVDIVRNVLGTYPQIQNQQVVKTFISNMPTQYNNPTLGMGNIFKTVHNRTCFILIYNIIYCSNFPHTIWPINLKSL
jgi:hypothetical protein